MNWISSRHKGELEYQVDIKMKWMREYVNNDDYIYKS